MATIYQKETPSLKPAERIKAAAVWFLSKMKRCNLICTECPINGIADVVGTNGYLWYEIEVKTSWSDFKRDFEKKKRKHRWMEEGFKHRWVPNGFYFAVTPDVQERAMAYLKDHKLPYGLLVALDGQRELTSVKPVRAIHHERVAPATIEQITARLGNEYISNMGKKLFSYN